MQESKRFERDASRFLLNFECKKSLNIFGIETAKVGSVRTMTNMLQVVVRWISSWMIAVKCSTFHFTHLLSRSSK